MGMCVLGGARLTQSAERRAHGERAAAKGIARRTRQTRRTSQPDALPSAGEGTMKVYLANEVGFCFGVKRAINMTKQALAEHNDVSILGDVVHNRTVTSELEARGLRKVSDIDDIQTGTMVIRAHGLPQDRIVDAHARGLHIVDATCPIVSQAQQAARELEDRGCQVVIIGDKNHAE